MIVVDASVIVKWFVPEVGDAAAKALLGASDALIAPELARVEVASALIRKGLRQELAPADVERTLSARFRALGDGQVVLLPDSDDIEAAAKLAMELQHPLPDCLYLAAAERLGAAMITANRAFVSRAKRTLGPGPAAGGAERMKTRLSRPGGWDRSSAPPRAARPGRSRG